MIEYQTIVTRKRLKEGGLRHIVKKFIDDLVVVASAGLNSIFYSYGESDPINKEILGLIEQNNGRLLAYHYLGESLIFTTVFQKQQEVNKIRGELLNRRYNPQDQRIAETGEFVK